MRAIGRDAKLVVAGYDMYGQRLAWSSSELMTHASIRGKDIALLKLSPFSPSPGRRRPPVGRRAAAGTSSRRRPCA
jgi:hypothetical protein